MIKFNYPGSVTHLTPFSWSIEEAPPGATWTASFTRNGAAFGTYNGAIPASGTAKASQSTLTEGDYVADFTFSNGEFIRFTIKSHTRPTFHWPVDFGAQKRRAPVLRPIKFGDGYEQSVPNGLNHNPAEWSVNVSQLTDMEARQVMLFLDSFGGHRPFWWRDPDGKLLQYKCSDYSRTYSDDDDNSVTATFKQYFG